MAIDEKTLLLIQQSLNDFDAGLVKLRQAADTIKYPIDRDRVDKPLNEISLGTQRLKHFYKQQAQSGKLV